MRSERRLYSLVLGVALSITPSTLAQDPTRAPKRIVIAEQGSFFVGGRTIRAPGEEFDPTVRRFDTDDRGLSFKIDQLYAQFQIPPHARRLPLVLIHGGGSTGKVWESTPDGREGYQTIFLRRRFAVYIVDFPRRGRAGFPSFNGPLGKLVDTPVIPDQTRLRHADEPAFVGFRLGPQFSEYFANTQFPEAGLNQFQQSFIPAVQDDANVVTEAIVALLDKIGPAILVAHSQAGRFACLAAIRSPNVKAIVSYEGVGGPLPEGEVPDPVALFDGVLFRFMGSVVPLSDFQKLTAIPIQVVVGDNIPASPTPNLVLDQARAINFFREQFVEAVNRHGGDASLLKLSEVGFHGNTHFMFSDLNNVEVADLMSQFLHEKGLDK